MNVQLIKGVIFLQNTFHLSYHVLDERRVNFMPDCVSQEFSSALEAGWMFSRFLYENNKNDNNMVLTLILMIIFGNKLINISLFRVSKGKNTCNKAIPIS